MTVLLGTTNPAKARRFSQFLEGYGVDFLTLADLNITQESPETGNTPLENATLKARFYGQYFDRVICNDSGLYLLDLPLDDPRQPGLHIRSPQGVRLDDDGMLHYYAGLARSLGGKTPACYLNGIAVYNQGRISGFMETGEPAKASSFWLVDVPSSVRHPGWPLDSISINQGTGAYFTESGSGQYNTVGEQIILGAYRQRLVAFLAQALGL